MTIGALGSVSFYASSEALHIFDDLQYKSSANYSEHKLHGKKPLLEFTGFGADELSFDMNLSVLLGGTPNGTHDKLMQMMRNQEVVTMVVGTTVIGSQWVITDVSRKFKTFYKDGQLISCDVSVTLKEYN